MTSLTSAGAKAQFFPNFLAWASPSELGRSRSTAAAPCPTSRSAVARPKPEAPPVITATRSCEEGSQQLHCADPFIWPFSRLLWGGSWSPLRLLPRCASLLTTGSSRFLIPRHPIHSPHIHVRQRTDFHLPCPTTAIQSLSPSTALFTLVQWPRWYIRANGRGKDLDTFTRLHTAAILHRLPNGRGRRRRWLANAKPQGGAGEEGVAPRWTSGQVPTSWVLEG